MGSHADRRTLLVGIDAACADVLEPLFDDGVLPTLASIFESGASGPLDSQIPPWTASAWPSLYTGMNPGKHGVYSFLSFSGYDWDVVNASNVRERTLWELLGEHDRTSVVVNAPVTHPPREFDGALVPGYTAPEDPTCHPEGLLEELRSHVGSYEVYPSTDGARDPGEGYREAASMRGRAFRYLADRFDPDFGFVQFQCTDSIFHEFPGDDDVVRAVYGEVDRQVEAVIDEFEPDAVVVASDHGIGPYGGYELRVNDLLREAGYVETKSGGRGMPSWSSIWEETLQFGDEPATRERNRVERAMAALARVGVTSQRIQAALERVGLDEVVARHAPTNLVRAATEQVDFPASRAYMRERIELGVRINLEGREPEGVVPREEYETVREALVEVLSGVTTPDGDPVFDDVARREQYFHGPEAEHAVDVVTVPEAFDHFLTATPRGARFGPPTEPWNHKFEGVFAAVGEGVDADADLSGADIFDVAPTVLATLGVPRDERMDGGVLPCVDDAGTRAYDRLEQSTAVATDDDAVEEHLADLGYLE